MNDRAPWIGWGVRGLACVAALGACDSADDAPSANGGRSSTTAGSATDQAGGGSKNSAGGASASGGKVTTGGGAGGKAATGGTTNGGTANGGTTNGGTTNGGTANGGATTADKSAGCGKQAPFTAAANHDITIDGTARQYFLTPPTGYDPDKAYPVILAFHGFGGNGEGIRSYYGLEEPAQGQAFFVYPTGSAVDGGVGWALSNDSVDVKLVDAILKELQGKWCVDEAAVFATGFSYGGWMATQIACARPKVIKGTAPIAGGGPFGACNDPIPAMVIHGMADGPEPIVSGENARDHYRDSNGCMSETEATDPSPCVALQGCKSPVLWCAHPGGHDIPDFAPAGIWSFFGSLR